MRYLACPVAILLAAGAAHAQIITVSGSGTFTDSAPTTDVSAPGGSFAFTYNTLSPLDLSTDFGRSPRFQGFEFLLNGTLVDEPLSGVTFNAGFGPFPGLFDLFFSDAPDLIFSGEQAFDGFGNLLPGTYAADVSVTPSLQTDAPEGSATVVLSESSVVPVSFSGTFGDSVPTTSVSAPGAEFSFSFDVATPFPLAASSGLLLDFSDFSYSLDGAPVDVPLSQVSLNQGATTFGGLFDLIFSDGQRVALSGEQVFEGFGGGSDYLLTPGTFEAAVAVGGDASGSGVVIIGLGNSVVPEPGSLAVLGLGLVCGLMRRRRVA